jgi:isovaleryl-CoA dehydrogenase
MGELGLHGITVEEEFGGLGLGYLEHVIAVRGSQPRLGIDRPFLRRALEPVRQPDPPLGEPEQKAKYLPKLISGEHVGSLAMSEAGAGSDVVSMKLRAEKTDGGYAQRHQILDHQRDLCRHAGRLCEDRRGDRAASPPS